MSCARNILLSNKSMYIKKFLNLEGDIIEEYSKKCNNNTLYEYF